MHTLKERKNDFGIGKAVLFILSPFLSFLISLRDLSSKSSYCVLIGICLLFGLNYNVTNDRSAEHNLDGSYYRELFERDYVGSVTSVQDILDNYFSFSSEKNTDVYVDIVSLLVSRFTSNYHLLFLVYAAIFTFFMLKSLKYLLTSTEFQNGSFVCLILVFLFLQNDIFNINGVRFWTAAWISVYSLFKFFLDNKKVYVLLALITPLIHPSFFLFLFLLIFSAVFNNVSSKLGTLLLISIIISPFLILLVQLVDYNYFPVFFVRYLDLYTSDVAIREYGERSLSSMYYIVSTLFRAASLVYVNILAVKISKKVTKDSNFYSLSNFLILFIIFCNLTTLFPSIGVRFIVLTYPLIAYLWINIFGIKQESAWIKVLPVFFIFALRSKIYYYYFVLDGDFFYMNLFHLIFKNI